MTLSSRPALIYEISSSVSSLKVSTIFAQNSQGIVCWLRADIDTGYFTVCLSGWPSKDILHARIKYVGLLHRIVVFRDIYKEKKSGNLL
jgi:hypothetical protein